MTLDARYLVPPGITYVRVRPRSSCAMGIFPTATRSARQPRCRPALDSLLTMSSVKLYHETAADNAASIIASGFHDSGPVATASLDMYGVFVADQPPSFGRGWVLLAIETDLSERDLAPYAYNVRVWRPHGNHYREWCVPAQVLNRYPRPRLVR